MSMFEDNRYRWRETYFVLFDSRQRPTLEKVRKCLAAVSNRYVLTNLSAEKSGRFDSLTLLAPDDFAALDICYTSGDEVREQVAALADEMMPAARETGNLAAMKRIRQCDARFDVLHFEQISACSEEEEDELEEMLDPGALLLVLDELARITDGVAVDPQSGTFMNEEG